MIRQKKIGKAVQISRREKREEKASKKKKTSTRRQLSHVPHHREDLATTLTMQVRMAVLCHWIKAHALPKHDS